VIQPELFVAAQCLPMEAVLGCLEGIDMADPWMEIFLAASPLVATAGHVGLKTL
jgi:hypothetical protein